MMPNTVWRARTIVERGGVTLIGCSPSSLHFLVSQRLGAEANVYWKKDKYGNIEWDCDAIDKNKKWGCCLRITDKSKPFCSHTLAAKLFLDKEEKT